MLQRIQTVWLFLATTALFCLFLFPSFQLIDDQGVTKIVKASGIYEIMKNQEIRKESFPAFIFSTILIGSLPFVIIFFYQNRKRQIKLCYATILLILSHSFCFIKWSTNELTPFTLNQSNYRLGLLSPSIAILFIVLAINGIRGDEKLIASTYRLR